MNEETLDKDSLVNQDQSKLVTTKINSDKVFPDAPRGNDFRFSGPRSATKVLYIYHTHPNILIAY